MEDGYRKGYSKGFLEGQMLGFLEIVVNCVRKNPELGKALYREYLGDEYYTEIISIIDKHPTWSTRHLAQRILFEATHIPPI